jgi:hypothetical protein
MTNKINIKKQKGGSADYPFVNQHNTYPIPNKVDFPISNSVSTNHVSSKDLYGCGMKGGNWNTNGSFKQRGGDCGCAGQPMQLGGAKKEKKQKGAGYGYSLDMGHPITNRPEVVRYQTDSAYQNVDTVMKGGKPINEYLANVSGSKKQKQTQNGGSAASDSLMDYFLDFQHRCRASEIY